MNPEITQTLVYLLTAIILFCSVLYLKKKFEEKTRDLE